MKELATIVHCTDRMTDYEHSMRDFCSTCAPYWDRVPICPTDRVKLNSPSGYCRKCKKYFDLNNC